MCPRLLRLDPLPPLRHCISRRVGRLPLLDFVESLELWDWDEDDDGLLSSLDIDLLGSCNLERSELGLELRDGSLEVNESLSDSRLDLGWWASWGVGGSEDLGGHDDDDL